MTDNKEHRGPMGGPLGAPHTPPALVPRALRGEPTRLEWTNEQVSSAHIQLQAFSRERRVGPAGYKATALRRYLEPTTTAIGEQAVALIEEFQRVEGPDDTPVPAFGPDGNVRPLGQWCTDPKSYHERDRALMRVVNTLTSPVRFTYEELIELNPPPSGDFWYALYDLIDPPRDPGALIPFVGPPAADDDAPPAPSA